MHAPCFTKADIKRPTEAKSLGGHRDNPDPGTPTTVSSVPSVDPESTMITSLGCTCWRRIAWTVTGSQRASFFVRMTIETSPMTMPLP